MPGRGSASSRARALASPGTAPSPRAGRGERAGGWGFPRQNAVALSSRITVATGASQRVCHGAPPGPASAGQEEGGPRLAGGSGQGPWGRPGCCLQARHRAPASPHPALGPNTEQTGRRQTDKQGTALGEGRGGVRQPEARKQDRLLCPQPRGCDRLNSPRDGHVSRGSCGRTRGRRGRESGDACRAQLRQAQACPCRRNSMD